MSTYVLVHGAWHGAWSWHEIVPRLEDEGHTVRAIDLPGHGIDQALIEEVTLDDHVARVGRVLDACEEPVILVGHSMAGAIITQVAEERPESVAKLVYVAAYLPTDGTSGMDITGGDENSQVPPNLEVNEERGTATMAADAMEEVLYHDCPPETVALGRSLVRPEAMASFTTPVDTSEERFGSVPRVYIQTQNDRVFSPDVQEEMYTALPCEDVLSLDTGHLPIFAAPADLAAHLDSVSV